MKILFYIFCLLMSPSKQQPMQIESEWESYLEAVYNRLSMYQFQRSRSSYNVSDLNDWGKPQKAQGLKVDKSNFKQFLTIMADYLPQSKQSSWFDEGNITLKQLQDLDEVLTLTIKEQPDVRCESSQTSSDNKKLVIKGHILRMFTLYDSLTCFGKLPETIEIFASSKIFMDKDVMLTKSNLVLVIMAPVWEIIGDVFITLEGNEGARVKTSLAKNGVGYGGDGDDGVPGNPGGPSGNFVGIGDIFINGPHLEILARGGDGSDGQDGGHGTAGENGEFTEDATFDCNVTVAKILRIQTTKNNTCYGTEGTPGGRGGNGGSGGFGGFVGVIKIFDLHKDTLVKTKYENGSVGTPGDGGHGDLGGNHGGYKRIQTAIVYDCLTYSSCFANVTVIAPHAPDGHDGLKGNNTKNIKHPEQPLKPESFIANVVNDYQFYLQDSLENEWIRRRLFNFSLKIFQNEDITKYYDTLAIISEFLILEEHFYSLYNTTNLLLFYEEIQNHTILKAKGVQDEDTKNALIYLYTTLATKICIFQDAANGKFIGSLDGFLKLFEENLQKLKDIKKEVLISEHTADYKNDIDVRIVEDKKYIDTSLRPLIDTHMSKTRDAIRSLIEEVREKMKEELKHIEELKKKKDKLILSIFLHVFTTLLSIVGSVLPMFGQIGATVAGVAMSVTSDLVSTFGHDESAGELPSATSFHETYGAVEFALKNKSKEEITAYQEEITSIQSLLNDSDTALYNALEKTKTDMNSWKYDDDIRGKYRGELQTIKQDFENKVTSRFLSEKALTKIGWAAMGVGAVTSLVAMGCDIAKDVKSMKHIDEEIEKSKEHIKQLQDYEKKIRSDLIPILKQMKEVINGLDQRLYNQSSAKLQAIALNVHTYLENVLNTIKSFTKNFKAEVDFENVIKAVEHSVSSMINVFDQIQHYKKEKEAVTLLSHIYSKNYRNQKIENRDISDALDKLDLCLQSNIILLRYRQSIDQLKLFAFPMAKTYFEDFKLPVVLERKKTVEDYLHNALQQIGLFRLRLLESRIYVFGQDQLRHHAMFGKDSLRKPFFIWSNLSHEDSISKLLSGEEVVFQADVNYHLRKNAIKFRNIEIRLKTHEKNQVLLDKILDDFMVTMTHMGSNEYRCQKEVYVINTKQQKFQFSFKKTDDKSVNTNLALKKLSEGDPMLSPFTTWKIRLISTVKDGYNLLKKFRGDVDLELVGEGYYFDYDLPVCHQNLNKYYEPKFKEDEEKNAT